MRKFLQRLFGGRSDETPAGGTPLQAALAGQERAERSLRHSSEEFEHLVAGVRDYAIFLLDREGYVRTWNAGAERIKGYRPDEIIGQHFSRFYPKDVVASGWPAHELEVATQTGRYEEEGWRIRKDGSRFWASVVITALRDEKGEPRSFLKITRDLTEHRQAEENARRLLQEEAARKAAEDSAQEITRQREQLHVTLASIGDGVIVTDNEGKVTFLNPVAEKLTGWKLKEAEGQPLGRVFRIINEETRQSVEDPVSKVFREGRVVGLANHTVLVAEDGREFPIEDSGAPIWNKDRSIGGVVLVFRDATEARKALESRMYLAAIVESSDDAIIGHSLDGTITSWNRGAERLYGYTAAEIIGKPLSLLAPPDHPDEQASIFERIKRGESIEHYETQRIRKDGSLVDASLTISPIRNAEGKIIGASKSARDITSRKEEERRKNEFLALLAHELRNPLAPLRNGLQILRLVGHDREATEKARGMMERQLQHLVRLVDDLLDVSRISRGKLVLHKERLTIAAVVGHALEVCEALIKQRGHVLTVTLPDEPVYVDADKTRLAQAVCNLLSNAVKYSDPGSQIWLTVQREGDEMVLRVKDTGIGIPHDMLPKVFDLFWQVDRSLEKAQGGLGVGLTVVKQLVEMHGGRVEVQSEGYGMGSEFILRLPVVLAVMPEPAEEENEQRPPSAARHRILVVDDNVDAASSLAMMLKIMDNEVRTAHDGQEGVEVAEAYRPDLILLDIGMPRLNGYDACRRIREQPWGKNMAIFALTGWGQDEDKRRSQEAGFDGHLVKPVEPNVLEKLLAELPARPGAPPRYNPPGAEWRQRPCS